MTAPISAMLPALGFGEHEFQQRPLLGQSGLSPLDVVEEISAAMNSAGVYPRLALIGAICGIGLVIETPISA